MDKMENIYGKTKLFSKFNTENLSTLKIYSFMFYDFGDVLI